MEGTWSPRYSRPLRKLLAESSAGFNLGLPHCFDIQNLPSLECALSNRWLHILTGLFITEETGRISHAKPEGAIVPAVTAGEWEREIKGKIKASLLGSNSSLRFPGSARICLMLFDAESAHMHLVTMNVFFSFILLRTLKNNSLVMHWGVMLC